MEVSQPLPLVQNTVGDDAEGRRHIDATLEPHHRYGDHGVTSIYDFFRNTVYFIAEDNRYGLRPGKTMIHVRSGVDFYRNNR